MHALIEVIFPVFLVIGFGYAAVWAGFFSTDSVDGLMRFTQNFAIPCLLFGAIASLDLSQVFDFALLFSFYSEQRSVFWPDYLDQGFCSSGLGKIALRLAFAVCFPIHSCSVWLLPNAPMARPH